MIIVIDEAIPFWQEAFSSLGEVRPYSGRNPQSEILHDADALIVRSITTVDASLLKNSSVRFVASASAGTDHIDLEYLRSGGIHFEYAAGCNANSVSEYIVTALHEAASRRHWDLKQKSLAIVGVGHVGSRVENKARALGMKVHLCDPPLRDIFGDMRYQPFDDILNADIITFHVPLTEEGLYPTRHMVDRKILNRLSPKQFLINAARGAIFDCQELEILLKKGGIEGAILDVWEGEPSISYSLLNSTDIGTAHIAGSSLDGKIRGTEMSRDALCKYFGIHSVWDTTSLFPSPKRIRPKNETAGQDAVHSVLMQAYNILKDDASLRAFSVLPEEQAAVNFERFRKKYSFRLEFSHFIVELAAPHLALEDVFTNFGFKTAPLP